jgi:cysteinyl-tRNA synthetase
MQYDFHLYNSLTGKKALFEPLQPKTLKLYVCGMTVYDHCHIGHARGMVVFDAVQRYFRQCGWGVTYVRNITDIDDKIIRRAKENQESESDLTARFIQKMHEDEASLGIQSPDHEPKATDYVSGMVALIEKLIDRGHAYAPGNGDVYFSVASAKDYGVLSKRDVEKLRSGARIEVNGNKRDPLDFVLWKAAKDGEPSWTSPWGDGRPGWHSECVVMATGLLGQPFDVHGGGMDLKFPHHENELAQASCCSDAGFARYWMHVGLLQVNDEKMSKSLNNFITICDAVEQYGAEVLRYFFLSGHYRSPVNFTEATLKQNKQALTRLYTALRGLDTQDGDEALASAHVNAFHHAMHDDFNTPLAMASLFAMAKAIQKHRQAGELKAAVALAKAMVHCAAPLGLLQKEPELFLQGEAGEDDTEIDALVAKRNAARASRDFALADRIRDDLLARGIIMEDSAGETRWRRTAD